MTNTTTTEQTGPEELARRIFDEVTAVLGTLYSDHLCRNLTYEDILDGVHVATDDDGEEWGL
jgi:hypothetical protein